MPTRDSLLDPAQIPRETREQRQQRRLAQLEQRQREEAAHLQRALQRQLQVESVRETQRQDTRLGRATNDDQVRDLLEL